MAKQEYRSIRRMPNMRCFRSNFPYDMENVIAARASRIMLLKYVQSIQLKLLSRCMGFGVSCSMCSQRHRKPPAPLCPTAPLLLYPFRASCSFSPSIKCIFDDIHEMRSDHCSARRAQIRYERNPANAYSMLTEQYEWKVGGIEMHLRLSLSRATCSAARAQSSRHAKAKVFEKE